MTPCVPQLPQILFSEWGFSQQYQAPSKYATWLGHRALHSPLLGVWGGGLGIAWPSPTQVLPTPHICTLTEKLSVKPSL